jgi:predicted alpha/beta superfamily hydrolase
MVVALTGCGVTAQAPPTSPAPSTQTGDVRVHQHASAVFGNTRQLRVLVPSGYDAPENRARRYPVLYLNDGQNLFDRATSAFTGLEWRVDETVLRLTGSGELPPLIVVGIDHAGRRQRPREYLPYPDRYLEPPEPHPAGARYPDFVVEEVVPFIDQQYRTIRDPANRGLGGSSYGALAALYTVVTRPGFFGMLLLESPSLYVDDGRIFRAMENVTRWPARVYVGVGTNEMGRRDCSPSDDGGEAVADVRRLAAMLRERGVPETHLRVVVEPCARHDEQAWAGRLPGALRFLFGN